MPLVVLQNTRLLWVRLAALIFACVAFSVAAHGAHLDQSIADWCMFCWIISFVGTLLVLIIEHLGLQSRIPVSWTNFPITLACYACLLCLSASIIFPLYEVKGYPNSKQRNYRITSTVFSCLATVAYLVEVSLTRAQPGEVAAYMATIPGLLKVCETFVASVIFVFISNPVSYNHHDALKWCLAVYCICFIISAAIVVVCVGECTGFLPFSFARFLSAYALLAALMYLSATIIWPVFQFDSHYSNHPKVYKDGLVIIAVLTALNFLIYVADLVYSARLVFVRA